MCYVNFELADEAGIICVASVSYVYMCVCDVCMSVCACAYTCACLYGHRSHVRRNISWCVCQVCREYQRGNCSRGETDCRFAHPSDSTMIDSSENTVTVCMDYIKGRCSRDKCKYFHPPAHLQAKIKAAQHQVNQATATAAMVSTGHIDTHVYTDTRHAQFNDKYTIYIHTWALPHRYATHTAPEHARVWILICLCC